MYDLTGNNTVIDCYTKKVIHKSEAINLQKLKRVEKISQLKGVFSQSFLKNNVYIIKQTNKYTHISNAVLINTSKAVLYEHVNICGRDYTCFSPRDFCILGKYDKLLTVNAKNNKLILISDMVDVVNEYLGNYEYTFNKTLEIEAKGDIVTAFMPVKSMIDKAVYNELTPKVLVNKATCSRLVYMKKANIYTFDDLSKYVNFVARYERFGKHDFKRSTKADLMKIGEFSPTNIITEGKKYTFGVEIETSAGYIPQELRETLNIDSQYDGSIVDDGGRKQIGGEYTTGVLTGDYGLKHLHEILNALSERCTINNSCSIHVHIGGMYFTKEFIVNAYKVYQSIEGELYDMLPVSRKFREHCQQMKKLPIYIDRNSSMSYTSQIENYYNQIVKLIACGKTLGPSVNKKLNHPFGKYCNYDRKTPRYWWINFIPALFNIKGMTNYTLEIRNHSATFDYEKIKNWILIHMGIISFIENNPIYIADNNRFSLDYIMRKSYSKNKSDYLIKYIKARKEYFSSSTILYDKSSYIYDSRGNVIPLTNKEIEEYSETNNLPTKVNLKSEIYARK